MSAYRIVTTAYPNDYWAEHGKEILGTANELNNSSWSFRESRHLFAHGLRTRSLAATGGSTEQMWLQAAAFVIFMSLLSLVGTTLTYRFDLGEHGGELIGSNVFIEILLVALLYSFTRSTRWPTFVFAGGLSLVLTLRDSWVAGQPSTWLTFAGLVLVAGAISVRGDGRRVMSARWMLALLLFQIAIQASGLYFLGVWPLPVLILGLVLVRFEPRLLAVASLAVGYSLLSLTAAIVDSDTTIETPNVPVLFAAFAAVAAVTIVIATRSNRRLSRQI